jgi:DNA polymerase I-like protein with 3'-5' exonuclease and polymerase domains
VTGVWSVDAEYGWHGAEVPSAFVPVVWCATNVATGEQAVFWGRDPRLAAWLDAHRDDLFVSHNLIAEARYLQTLGLRPPARWWDTMIGFRYATNSDTYVPSSLDKALPVYGITHRFGAEKGGLQKWIGELRFDPDSPADLARIRAYCQEDVRTTALLYKALYGRVPDDWMTYLMRYALATARMEARGIKIDTEALAEIQDNREVIVRQLTAEVNATCHVLDGNQVRQKALLGWCIENGIGWPFRTPTGKARFDEEAWDVAKNWHPFLAEVNRVRNTAGQLLDRTIPADPADGRHYFGCIPVAQKTGRSSPKGCILGGPKWLRCLLTPTDDGHVLINVDFKSEEVAIAAYLSGDDALMADYGSDDFYLGFAARAGAVPRGATKLSHGDVRTTYKTAALGIGYGQSEYSLARDLRIDQAAARRLIDQHRRAYPKYWSWRERFRVRAYRQGRCRTRMGWPMRVPPGSNPRTAANLPVQGSGGDLLREVVLRLEGHGLTLLATNHDSCLLECPQDDQDHAREELDVALRESVDTVLPGCPLKWEVKTYETRYEDPDGEKMWERIRGILGGGPGVPGRGYGMIPQMVRNNTPTGTK